MNGQRGAVCTEVKNMSKLEENPRRPPREWWYRCTAGVEESNRLYGRDVDPSSVCGALWYRKMRAADKRLIVQKAEEKKMQKNPRRPPLLKRASLRSREGTRVRFEATPASLALYSSPPKRFSEGTITSVSFGGSRRTSLPGPGGGLVYVRWDDGSFQGVSPLDLVVLPTFAPNPTAGGGGMLALAALAAAGIAWLLLRDKKEPKLVGPAPKPAPTYVNVTCVIKKELLDAWGKAHGIGILVSDPVGTAIAIGATALPLVVWNEGENYLRAANNVTSPDALATKNYCEWAAKPPSSPPPSAPPAPPQPPPAPVPTSAPQSAALQGGGGEVYLTKRLFVWDGYSWLLVKQEGQSFKPVSNLPYSFYFAWPMFEEIAPNPPPYYYADGWEWDGTSWKKQHCSSNFKSPGCDQ